MKKIVFLALGIFICQAVFGQQSFFDNYVYQSWNSFGTLNGTTVTDIVQTKDGYINIGTYEGLARFDGVSFTTHKKNSSNDLSFVSVRAFLEDSKGNIWIGSNDEGLQKISKTEKKVYTTWNGLPNNSVRCLCEDKRGNIWVGTAAGVVYITPQGYMITPQFEAGTISKGLIATSLYCDSTGRIWLLTANECGLFSYSNDIFRTHAQFDRFGVFFATAITQDIKGNYWIGLGTNGLYKLENGKIQKIISHTSMDTNSTYTIYPAADGSIWFGLEKGIVVYSDGKFYEYEGSNLSEAKINKIVCDREDNLWFATDRNGVGKLTNGRFRMIKLGITVNSIEEDRFGNVWAATDDGIRCFSNDHEVKNQLTEYTKGLRIRDVEATKAGHILASCYTAPGQLFYDGQAIKNWSKEKGLAGNKVRVAIEAANGDFYIGTTTGLSIIHRDGTIKNLKQLDGLENEYVMALYQDTNGVIWIGTDGGGIYLMKNEELFSHITSEDGLAGNVIFKIDQNLDGAFWICSGSGITRCPNFDSKKGKPTVFENIDSENGIQTDSMFQILVDGSNMMWMISNHGISSTAFSDVQDFLNGKREEISVKFYNKNDGLDSNGPTSTAKNLVDRYGRLWIAMVDGIAIYDPVKVTENPIMPLVQIETVTVDNNIVLDNRLYPSDTISITLKPGTKRVDISYSGLSFDAPERLTFTHKLTNFEDDFCPPTTLRSMSYTNLKPGNHIFYVNAINGDGFYSEQAEAVLFVQKPYIYQIPAFWVVLIIGILGSLILSFYVKQQKIIKENLRLEKMVQERTSELKLEKEKSDHLLRAILPEQIANELKDNIHSIGQNYDDVTILFSDIVDFTKTSSGYTAAEIVHALNELFSLFDIRAQNSGVEKIKTIGDAYMAACGLPTPNKDHAKVMVAFAKGMLDDLEEYNKTAKIKFNIRIGINCGPAAAGVIGRTKFIYDVWGNTVNVASRMESASRKGKIRVSETVYKHLTEANVTDIKFSKPIECDIKGKGLMTTYEIL